MTAPIRYNTHGGGRAPFRFSGKSRKDARSIGTHIAGLLPGRASAGGRAGTALEGFLGGDYGTGLYEDIFAKAAMANAAPIQEQYEDVLGRSSANVARRFGGNPSSEEARIIGTTSRGFGRLLSEQLAAIGPQAVAAAQGQQRLLAGIQAQYAGQESDLLSLLLQAARDQRGGGSPWAKILGTALGAGVGFFAGNPAAGAQVGGAVGGSFG